MDSASAKLLLASYRTRDADDPAFAEALRAVAADPALRVWLEDGQQFDAEMASHIQGLVVPADVKSQILLGYRAQGSQPITHSVRQFGIWALASGLAALLIVGGFFAWPQFVPREPRISSLAQQAIFFTNQMPPLQFVCFDATAVAGWINKQPASQKVGLHLPPPPSSLSMHLIGSSMVEWRGRPVVMVCLQNGQRMAMLYILNAQDAAAMQPGAPELPDGANEVVQRADWVVRTSKAEGQLRLLATKGRPEDLDFPLPY